MALALFACAEGASAIRSRLLPAFEDGRYRTIAYAKAAGTDALTPLEGALGEDVRAYAPGVFLSKGYQPPASGFDADLYVQVGRDAEGALRVDVLDGRSGAAVWTGRARSAHPKEVQELRDTLDLILVGFPRAAARPVAY